MQGANGSIAAQTDVPLVTVTVDQAARTLTVAASAQTGRAMLTISDSTGASVRVPVRVALDAGVVRGSIAINVTGNPIDPAWLRAQVAKSIVQSVQLQQGAALQTPAFTLPALLPPGASAAVPVALHISGGDRYYDVDAVPTVTLQNVDVPAFAPTLLFYDDDPEHLLANGIAYRNTVSSGSPARLYYYHQNLNDPKRLLVVLRSRQVPAIVQLIDAFAGPNADVMTVGHNVSRDFLISKPRNQGFMVALDPGVPYVVEAFSMQPLDGAAGSLGINVRSGGPVEVCVVAVSPDVTDAQVESVLDGPVLPGDGHHRTGVFSLNGYGSQTLAYTIGGPDAEVDYGAGTPPPLAGSAGHDYGEYGVLHTLTFDLQNPSAQAADLYLYEQPMGGAVRSSFLVNGTLVQLGCARVAQRYQIGAPIGLAAGAVSQLVVQTMTDGGSNYPLEIGVTATPPLPTTPSMFAANGCFPKATAPAPSPSPVPEPTGRLS